METSQLLIFKKWLTSCIVDRKTYMYQEAQFEDLICAADYLRIESLKHQVEVYAEKERRRHNRIRREGIS